MSIELIVGLVLIVIFLCIIALYRLNNRISSSVKVLAQYIKNRESIDKVKNELEVLRFANKDLEDEIKMGRIFYDNSREAIVVMNKDGRIISVNSAFETITGYELTDVKDQYLSILDSGKRTEFGYKKIYQKAIEQGRCEEEIWNRKKTGEIYHEKLALTVVKDVNGNVTNFIAIFKDITNEKELKSKLLFEAKMDSLTKLPNRSLFFDRLGQALKAAKRNRQTGALIFIDLDHFKSINDTLGHHVGDLLLKEVSVRLQRSVRASDTVARLSGDEFTVILPQVANENDAGLVASTIIENLVEPYKLDGNVINVTCSAGIAVFFHDGSSPEALLTSADSAMYSAKKEGRNKFKYCSTDLDETAHKKRDIDLETRRALRKDAFYFDYRPIISAKGVIKEVDLILNLDTNLYSKLKNVDIISLSEESNLIVDITNWMFDKLKEEDLSVFKFNDVKAGIYVSAISFKQSNLVDNMKEKFTSDAAKYIKLKIDETILSNNIEEAIPKLKGLREHGFEISIINFGKGKISLINYEEIMFNSIELNKLPIKAETYKRLLGNAESLTDNIIIGHEIVSNHKDTIHNRALPRTLEKKEMMERLKSI